MSIMQGGSAPLRTATAGAMLGATAAEAQSAELSRRLQGCVELMEEAANRIASSDTRIKSLADGLYGVTPDDPPICTNETKITGQLDLVEMTAKHILCAVEHLEATIQRL